MHYLLFYEFSKDYANRRAEFRARHLALAWPAHEQGELVLGDAVGDPPEGALLLFQGASPEGAERFARTDPYVLNGLVERWYVRQWNTVAGAAAANPVRPDAAPR